VEAAGPPLQGKGLAIRLLVRDWMTRKLVTLLPEASVAEGPVVDGGSTVVAEEELLGIVTSSDVMRALVTLVGLPEAGCRIKVRAPNRTGSWPR